LLTTRTCRIFPRDVFASMNTVWNHTSTPSVCIIPSRTTLRSSSSKVRSFASGDSVRPFRRSASCSRISAKNPATISPSSVLPVGIHGFTRAAVAIPPRNP